MSEEERETVGAWAERLGFAMACTPAPMNPHWGQDQGNGHEDYKAAASWNCVLTRPRLVARQVAVVFTKGAAHRRWKKHAPRKSFPEFKASVRPGERVPMTIGRRSVAWVEMLEQFSEPEPPELGEVLACMQMDAVSMENAPTFEEWAQDLGFDEDSRQAERSYRATLDQSRELRALVADDDQWRHFLWNLEDE